MNAEQSHTISQVGDNTPPEAAVSKSKPSAAPITGYNMRSPAVKRLMREAAELSNPEVDITAQPTETNLFEWHFTIRGPESSEFEDGVYHGRIIFPSEYPMKPPSFILLTPNGRFQTDEKICLSISNYHPETWLPSWSIRTALVALRSFMTTPGNEGAIGALNFSPDERKKLAKKSRTWECHECGLVTNLLLPSQAKQQDDTAKSAKEENVDTSSKPLGSPVQPNETPADNKATESSIKNRKATDAVTTTATATNTTSIKTSSTDNHDSRTGSSSSATARNARVLQQQNQQQHQQQHESIRNILYDFGIACFVILILGLCLRRLFVIFDTL